MINKLIIFFESGVVAKRPKVKIGSRILVPRVKMKDGILATETNIQISTDEVKVPVLAAKTKALALHIDMEALT